MKILTRIVVPVFAAVMLVGCAGPAGEPMPSKMVCIISGEPVDSDSPSAEFMGETVRFCCRRCAGRWNKMDEEGRKAAFEKMMK